MALNLEPTDVVLAKKSKSPSLAPGFAGFSGLTTKISGVAVMVSETVTLCSRGPLVPMMVSVEFPSAAAFVAETVSVDVVQPSKVGVTDVGFRVASVPDGAPITDRSTVLVKPFNDVTLMVEVSKAPFGTVNVDGDAVMVKSGSAKAVNW